MSDRVVIYQNDSDHMVDIAMEAAVDESVNTKTTTGTYIVEREGDTVFLSESSGRTLHPEEVEFFTDYIQGWMNEELKRTGN